MYWSEGGYYTAKDYIVTGFFRETAPSWLDFVALTQAQPPPRRSEGEDFTLLELGCGQGLGLCLMAAAYPEGTFLGLDLSSNHIAHAQRLAQRLGLTNVFFHEKDLLDLSQNIEEIYEDWHVSKHFDYIVAHGLFTWVSASIQDAILDLVAALLRPGGLFYCSYNTLPGWLDRSMIHHLVQIHLEMHGPAGHQGAMPQTLEMLGKLIGSPDDPHPLGRWFPALRERISDAAAGEMNYLLHEYGHRGSQPQFVADMHSRFLRKQLTFLGSATLPELFEDWLPTALRELMKDIESPILRQSLQDLFLVKCFRRDVYVRGQEILSPTEQERCFSSLRFRMQIAPEVSSYDFSTSVGLIQGKASLLRMIESRIEECPSSVSELAELVSVPCHEMVSALALLMHSGRIGVDRGQAGSQAKPGALEVNQLLMGWIREGQPYPFLVAPLTGCSLSLDPVEAFLYEAIRCGLSGEMMVACVTLGMTSMGFKLEQQLDHSSSDEQELHSFILDREKKLRHERLPFLIRLGCLPQEEVG